MEEVTEVCGFDVDSTGLTADFVVSTGEASITTAVQASGLAVCYGAMSHGFHLQLKDLCVDFMV